MKSVEPILEPDWTAETLHVFGDRLGIGAELHVHADHLEVHTAGGKEVLATWYRHTRKVAATRANGSHALAITDGGGQVHRVPMTEDQVDRARWLIDALVERAERSHG